MTTYESFLKKHRMQKMMKIGTSFSPGTFYRLTGSSFDGYEIMSDDAIATATLDRLLHHAHVISLKGDSYRMKDRIKTGVVDSLGL